MQSAYSTIACGDVVARQDHLVDRKATKWIVLYSEKGGGVKAPNPGLCPRRVKILVELENVSDSDHVNSLASIGK